MPNVLWGEGAAVMTLRELHAKLSKDPSYRKQYAKLGGVVELAMHVRAAREQRGITQDELASATGLSTFDISRFETLSGAPEPDVISKIVDHLEVELRRRGIHVGNWIIPVTDQRKEAGTIRPGAGARAAITSQETLRDAARRSDRSERSKRTQQESQPKKE
jgi:transcriptional regulator with XRE-family HTH domain